MTNTLEVYILPQNVSVKVCFGGYLAKGSSYRMRWVIVNWDSELTWILDPHILRFLFLHPKMLLCLCQICPWKSQALTKQNVAQLLTLALEQALVLQGNYLWVTWKYRKGPGSLSRIARDWTQPHAHKSCACPSAELYFQPRALSFQCVKCFSLSKRRVPEFGERGRTCVLVYQIGLPASLRE